MLQGVVIKAYNGYYYVQNKDRIFMCTIRGRFKKERFSLLVGDEVEFEIVGTEKGIIEGIFQRKVMLKRPMVANVDQVIITFAASNPDISSVLLDRFLVLAELSNISSIICINKIDLADSLQMEALCDRYRKIGYPVIPVSAKNGIGIIDVASHLHGKVSVFAGPSGVGKSTLLNMIEPGLELNTGAVSKKIGRGKHTTRFAELLPLSGGGFVVDTPGFSSTQFEDVEERRLTECFPEFRNLSHQCKFTTCLHYREPQCAVKEAVSKGEICEERYASYIEILTEIQESRKGYR